MKNGALLRLKHLDYWKIQLIKLITVSIDIKYAFSIRKHTCTHTKARVAYQSSSYIELTQCIFYSLKILIFHLLSSIIGKHGKPPV